MPAPVQRCFVCGEPGRIDPAQPTILVCRSAHRSLIGPGAAPPPAARPIVTPATSLLPLDGRNITVSAADLDAMLADPEVLQALSPDIRSALEQVRTQMGRP
ncbi:MAG: hypothetical protein IT372_24295 [Polyangiaceae bacterium]|nr:hypothetical protein [Polyangiaceae bacterium]